MIRKLAIAAVAVLAVAALAVLLDPTRVLWGTVRGEPFFEQRPSSYWLRRLRSDDPGTRDEAWRRLHDGGTAAVPLLAELLRERPGGDEEVAIRRRAAEQLGRLGTGATPAANALMVAMNDPDDGVRSAAIAALGECGSGGTPAAAAQLAEQLFGSHRLEALDALGRLGPKVSYAVPAVKLLLNHDQVEVRRAAARTLQRMGSHALPAALSLKAALSDPDGEVRGSAAAALGELGSASWIAVPELVKQLKDENAAARLGAAQALGKVGAPAKPAVSALKSLASDPSEPVRQAAAASVRQLEMP